MNEDDIIQEIIESFETFALGDIRHNVAEKPIAAFILCSCFIDQLAAFRYNHGTNENKKHYIKFIKEYLPEYVPLNLYQNLRCNLLHNYTIDKYLTITSDDVAYTDNTNVINSKRIFSDLERVFKKIKDELNNVNSETRKNALDRYKDSKIITKKERKITAYLDWECQLLANHYKGLIEAKVNQVGLKKVSIGKIKSPIENHFFIGVILDYENPLQYFLADLVEHLGLEPMPAVLESLSGNLHNTHVQEGQGNSY